MTIQRRSLEGTISHGFDRGAICEVSAQRVAACPPRGEWANISTVKIENLPRRCSQDEVLTVPGSDWTAFEAFQAMSSWYELTGK